MRPTCPKCGWNTTHRSSQTGKWDIILEYFFVIPFRCRSCGKRFRRYINAAQRSLIPN